MSDAGSAKFPGQAAARAAEAETKAQARTRRHTARSRPGGWAPGDPLPTPELVAGWFRGANPKLANLPTEAVADLARTVSALTKTMSNDSYSRFSGARFQLALMALRDAHRAADQLREAITRYQRHMAALGESGRAFDAVIEALDQTEVFGPSRRARGGRPANGWGMIVAVYHRAVERILQANGFPRASTTSDTGPAAAVLAELIRYLTGHEVTPSTIARDWRVFEARSRAEDGANAGDTQRRFPPRGKQSSITPVEVAPQVPDTPSARHLARHEENGPNES